MARPRMLAKSIVRGDAGKEETSIAVSTKERRRLRRDSWFESVRTANGRPRAPSVARACSSFSPSPSLSLVQSTLASTLFATTEYFLSDTHRYLWGILAKVRVLPAVFVSGLTCSSLTTALILHGMQHQRISGELSLGLLPVIPVILSRNGILLPGSSHRVHRPS